LLAEDLEPFRELIMSVLKKIPDVSVVCEVADGFRAVQMAGKLEPDLILLDIDIPELGGIEVARRIRRVSPNSKILLLAEESSADVLDALREGPWGYIIKANIAIELGAAARAALRDSCYFLGRTTTEASHQRFRRN